MITQAEIGVITELQRNGFIYAGMCTQCQSRAKKYRNGKWMFKVYKNGTFKLYVQNQLISGYEPSQNIQAFIDRTKQTS